MGNFFFPTVVTLFWRGDPHRGGGVLPSSYVVRSFEYFPGGGALLSGHYRGRRSAWDQHGDKKKMQMVILESARQAGSEKWSTAPLLRKIHFSPKKAKIKAPDTNASFPAPLPRGVWGAHTSPPPLGAMFHLPWGMLHPWWW